MIKVLLTEVQKCLNGLSPELMNQVFYLHQNHYNLRDLNVFAMDNLRDEFMLNSTFYRENQQRQNATV